MFSFLAGGADKEICQNAFNAFSLREYELGSLLLSGLKDQNTRAQVMLTIASHGPPMKWHSSDQRGLISWFMLCELNGATKEDYWKNLGVSIPTIPSAVVHFVYLDLLIDLVAQEVPDVEDAMKELRQYGYAVIDRTFSDKSLHTSHPLGMSFSYTSSLLSDKFLAFLTTVLRSNQLFGLSIVEFLLSHTGAHKATSLALQRIVWEVCETVVQTEGIRGAIGYLTYMHCKDTTDESDKVLSQILSLCSDDMDIAWEADLKDPTVVRHAFDGNDSNRTAWLSLLGVLLDPSRTTLLRRLSIMEDQLRRKMAFEHVHSQNREIYPLLNYRLRKEAKNELTSQELRRDLFQYILVTQDCVAVKCLEWILALEDLFRSDTNFSAFQTPLDTLSDIYPSIRCLGGLMLWDILRDSIGARERAMHFLWRSWCGRDSISCDPFWIAGLGAAAHRLDFASWLVVSLNSRGHVGTSLLKGTERDLFLTRVVEQLDGGYSPLAAALPHLNSLKLPELWAQLKEWPITSLREEVERKYNLTILGSYCCVALVLDSLGLLPDDQEAVSFGEITAVLEGSSLLVCLESLLAWFQFPMFHVDDMPDNLPSAKYVRLLESFCAIDMNLVALEEDHPDGQRWQALARQQQECSLRLRSASNGKKNLSAECLRNVLSIMCAPSTTLLYWSLVGRDFRLAREILEFFGSSTTDDIAQVVKEAETFESLSAVNFEEAALDRSMLRDAVVSLDVPVSKIMALFPVDDSPSNEEESIWAKFLEKMHASSSPDSPVSNLLLHVWEPFLGRDFGVALGERKRELACTEFLRAMELENAAVDASLASNDQPLLFEHVVKYFQNLRVAYGLAQLKSESLLEFSPSAIISSIALDASDLSAAKIAANDLGLDYLSCVLEEIACHFLSDTNSEASRPLTLDFVQHIAEESSFTLGAFAAVLFGPVGRPEMKQYLEAALTLVQKFPAFKRWILVRREDYDDIDRILSSTMHTMIQSDVADDTQSRQLKDRVAMECAFLLSEGKELEQYYVKAVDRLIACGQFQEALTLADVNIPSGAPDLLLKKLADFEGNRKHVWRYVIRMRNKLSAYDLALQYRSEWSADAVEDVFRMCYCHLPQDSAEQKDALSRLNDIILFRDILEVKPSTEGWNSWIALENIGSRRPEQLVLGLIEKKRFDLARRVISRYGLVEMGMHVEETALMDLLEPNCDTTSVVQALSCLPSDGAEITKNLIKKVSQYNTKLFLVHYLLSTFLADMTESEIEHWKKLELGWKVLTRLSANMQWQFDGLVSCPEIMVENLLIASEFLLLSQLFTELPQLCNDQLVIGYARKALNLALERPKKGSAIQKSSSSSNIAGGNVEHSTAAPSLPHELGSNEWSLFLNTDKEHNEEVRQSFRYAGTPSLEICRSCLDLCQANELAGFGAIDIAQDLSQRIHSVSLHERSLYLMIISSVLTYSRQKFILVGGSRGADGMNLCDTIIGFVELLREILLSGFSLPFSLMDFTNGARARRLRDALIREDRLELALEVSLKASVEAESVWLDWGLSLIRIGKYEQARKKLAHCFIPVGDSGRNPRSKFTESALHTVIAILEGSPPVSGRRLKTQYSMLLESVKAGKKKKAESRNDYSQEAYFEALHIPSPLKRPPRDGYISSALYVMDDKKDDPRFQECTFYLERYGSPKMLVAFFVKHNLIDEACRSILATQLPTSVFIDEVVRHCVQNGKLPRLQTTLLEIDPSLTAAAPYLLEVCRCFAQEKKLDLLYLFQVFMKDDVRAGHTCIHMFLQASDFESRMGALENAKAHFMEALMQSQHAQRADDTMSMISEMSSVLPMTLDMPVLPSSQISKYLKVIKFQMQVCRAFGPQSTEKEKFVFSEDISLFGSKKKKCEIAEVAISFGLFDLGYRLINEFRLPDVSIYANAAISLAASGSMTKITDFLGNLKESVQENDFNEICYQVIVALVNGKGDLKGAEKLIVRLSDEKYRYKSLIKCNKLKQAYLSAVKIGDRAGVQEVLDEAKRTNSKFAQDLCIRYLEQSK